MKVVLMNKNTEVLVLEYNVTLRGFDQVLEYKNIDYAPVIITGLFDNNENFLGKLSDWFKGRGIPSHRDSLYILLAKLNIHTPEELLDKAFGLSLSDQYWIKPYDSNMEHKDINFFENDFDSVEFTEATFSNSSTNITEKALLTPNNTTDGMLKKSWIIEDGKRLLLKGGYHNEKLQPFNEVLATWICERLGFDHVPYNLKIVSNQVVSTCECFIDTNTEYVPAYQVMYSENHNYTDDDYKDYLKILTAKGIKKAKEKLENMIILDYLILNNDRHMNNFGIIRNVETLAWIDVAPIFDSGQALNVTSYSPDEIIIDGHGKFFYRSDIFDDIIKNVTNLKRIDISKLDGLVEDFDKLLTKYQPITKFSNERIHKLCVLLNRRINKLKELIENN